MLFVLDASIAACWCYRDEEDTRADAASDLLQDGGALVPVHWWFELRNVLLVGERRRRLSSEETAAFLGRVARLPITLEELPSEAAVLSAARRHRLTFYDAAYLELAQRKGLPLATLDEQLIAAARTESVPIVGRKS